MYCRIDLSYILWIYHMYILNMTDLTYHIFFVGQLKCYICQTWHIMNCRTDISCIYVYIIYIKYGRPDISYMLCMPDLPYHECYVWQTWHYIFVINEGLVMYARPGISYLLRMTGLPLPVNQPNAQSFLKSVTNLTQYRKYLYHQSQTNPHTKFPSNVLND